MNTSWRAFSDAAPDLAAAVSARFEANLHHILGTLRIDGSIRLSGTEVAIDSDHVRIGMMPESHKLDDVRRDQRVELHSAPLEPDLAEGDAKLTGVLVDVGATDGQPGTAFVLDVTRASLVKVVGDELEFTTWSPDTGLRAHRRH